LKVSRPFVWPVKYLLHGPLVIRHSHSANIRAIRGRLSPLNSCLLVFIRVHSWLAELSENSGSKEPSCREQRDRRQSC